MLPWARPHLGRFFLTPLLFDTISPTICCLQLLPGIANISLPYKQVGKWKESQVLLEAASQPGFVMEVLKLQRSSLPIQARYDLEHNIGGEHLDS